MNPPMSWRTLYRWEKNGIPALRDSPNRDSWVEQLAELYGVDPKKLGNGTS